MGIWNGVVDGLPVKHSILVVSFYVHAMCGCPAVILNTLKFKITQSTNDMRQEGHSEFSMLRYRTGTFSEKVMWSDRHLLSQHI